MAEKRTIEELITRYELEPTIREIFVEGSSDKALIEWFLINHSIDDVVVYEIDTVEVPFERITELLLEDNNRGRVITLALALCREGKDDFYPRIACVADTDFDSVTETTYECPILILTVYTSLEAYLFKTDVVDKFLSLVITNFPYDAETVLLQLSDVLTELFLIRLVNQQWSLGIDQLQIERFCRIEGHTIVFDVEVYINRYLHKGAAYNRKEEFLQQIETYRERLSNDPRMHIHGHDFTNLLQLYITKVKRRRASDPDYFARSLFGVLEMHHIEGEPLFVELARRFA